jgi:hypothetical protein
MRWSTFLRLHAQGIIACDFLVVVTATFRLLYVFVVIEHRSRRLIHCNVTAHPTSAWTLQQLRENVGRMSPRIASKAASAWRPWVELTCSLLTKPERRPGGILFKSPMGRIRKPRTKRNERRAR